MQLYKIGYELSEIDSIDNILSNTPYVAVLSTDEWQRCRDRFDIGIDLEIRAEDDTTKIEVNYDSLTGCFSIPDRDNVSVSKTEFAFALDEKGIILIDDSGKSPQMISNIIKRKKFKTPGLERFIYVFLEEIVADDLRMLDTYEKKLESAEGHILDKRTAGIFQTINDIRYDLLVMRTHYNQLIDLSVELEENENGFFGEESLRFFHMFTQRVERYRDQLNNLREYAVQVRDLYQSQSDIRQNKIMAVLTVITTMFFPLSIITSWYGMNFAHMPELQYSWSYPVLIGICAAIVITEIIIFKKKKWL